ncbi:MAG: T9SS type A sorting domain-containing protein [Flavobacteriales bacterium]|nr:T9SS type A sorting domain-containing protein [Flavobacteriales bacterium]
MKRFLFGILIVFSAFSIKAQSLFVALDEVPNVSIEKTITSNQNLYAFSPNTGIGYRAANFRFRYWNGLFWTSLPTLNANNVFYDSAHQMRLAFHKNELYVGGSFYAQNEQIKGIVKWDGERWKSVAGGIQSSRIIHDEFSISGMKSFQNQLFVCGDFDLADGRDVKNLVRLQNDFWHPINSVGNSFNSLTVANDTLYVSGNFSEIESVECRNLAGFANDRWFEVPHSFTQNFIDLTSFQNHLVAINSEGFYFKNDQTWQKMGNMNLEIVSMNSIEEYNGKLYASGLFKDSKNNLIRLISIDQQTTEIILFDADIAATHSTEISLSTYDNKLVISGYFSKLKGKNFDHIAVLKPGNSILSGRVFIDNNRNCVFDAGDEPRQNALISLNNGSYYTSTNAQGFYSLFIPNNQTSTIKIFAKDNENPNCNGEERTVRTTNTDSVLVENFALQIDPGIVKLKASITGQNGFLAKHGYTEKYVLSCHSADKSKFPVLLSLKIDERLTDAVFSVKPTTISQHTIGWELSENQVIDIDFRIDPDLIEMNEKLLFEVNAQSINQANIAESSLEQMVVSAFDPNDKQCDKEEIVVGEKNLNYHIRFQNLGTAAAANIHVVDTIDPTMPLEYLQILDNSHHQHYSSSYKVRGHAIVWSFEEIYLMPQQWVGDEESSGYITYLAGLSNQLTVGQTIENTAYIYFDYQKPVVTNTTVSKVVEKPALYPNNSDDFTLFPNPTNGMIQVFAKNKNMLAAIVITTDGKIISSEKFSTNQASSTIDLSKLQAGIYWVRIEHSLGFETLPVVLTH